MLQFVQEYKCNGKEILKKKKYKKKLNTIHGNTCLIIFVTIYGE